MAITDRSNRKPLNSLNAIARLFAEKFLDRISYPDIARDAIREYTAKGTVIYVHRSEGVFWHLALRQALIRAHLPLPQISAGLNAWFIKPVFRTIKRLLRRKKATSQMANRKELLFSDSIKRKNSGELFLRKPKLLLAKRSMVPQYMRSLITLQRTMDEPIYLFPHLLAFRSTPSPLTTRPSAPLFGSTREPGFLRALIRLLIFSRQAKWEVSEPLNLKTLINESTHLSDELIARKARFSLLTSIAKMERTFHGPPVKSPTRMRIATLRDPDLHKFVENLAQETGIPLEKLNNRVERIYKELAAKFDIDFIRLLDKFLSLLWDRIYDGLSWSESDIERLRKASKHGPLIFIPSHRSHIDYLVVSHVLHLAGIMPPHIAAGSNLSFFPLGAIFRRGGAYFIRRQFKGDPLYAQVVKSYLKRLLKEGFSQEFFIEGARSRSGKPLPPKVGLLSMIVDCLGRGKLNNAVFVPTSISYEKLIEANSYRRELHGHEKKSEDAKGLVKSARFLNKRYGRVSVTFDEPIFFEQQSVPVLAYQIMNGIMNCSVVTPTALVSTALFGARRRSLSKNLIRYYCRKLVGRIKEKDKNTRISEDIGRAIGLLSADGLITEESVGTSTYYKINEKTVLSLDFYKNNIIHHFVADSILANAYCSLSRGPSRALSKDLVFARAQILGQIFKNEFVIADFDSFARRLDDSLSYGISHNIIIPTSFPRRRESKISALGLDPGLRGDDALVDLLLNKSRASMIQFNFAAQLIANFTEGYHICFKRLATSADRSSNEKALVQKLLNSLRAAYLNGTIECPEASSKEIVSNALNYCVRIGALQYDNGKPIFTENKQYNEAKSLLQAIHVNRAYF